MFHPIVLGMAIGALGGEMQADPAAKTSDNRVDHYGDPLPDGAVTRFGSIGFSAGQGLHDVNFSPDGKTVAGQVYGGLIFWDLKTGKELRRFKDHQHDWTFYAGFAFSGDGKRVVAIGQREIHVWDIGAGKPLLLHGSWYQRCTAAFSPDGAILALSGERQVDNKSVKDAVLWDATTGEVLRVLGDANGPIAYSPAGDAVCTCYGESVFLYDPATAKQRLEIPTAQKETTALAFAPDGKVLATAGTDRSIVLWDAGTGKKIRRLVGHEGGVSFLRFSADGKTLISRDLKVPISSDDPATVVVWDLESGERLRSLKVGMSSLDVAPDGATLAVGDGDRVRLWDLTTGKERPTQRAAGCDAIVFSRDGATVVTGGHAYSGKPHSVIQIWDAASGKLVREWDSDLYTGSLTLSPNSALLAEGGWSPSSSNTAVRLWDLATGRRVAASEDDFYSIDGLRFSDDGKTVGLINKHGLYAIDALTGKVLHTTKIGDFAKEDRRALTASAHFIAVGVNGLHKPATEFGGPAHAALYLLDASTGRLLRKIGASNSPDDGKEIRRLTFSLDERLLASQSEGNRVQLWEAATGKEWQALPKDVQADHQMVFSPDAALIAFGDFDGAVHVIETASGLEIRRFHSRADSVWALAFSPDSATLAADDGASSVLLWDVAGNGKPTKSDAARTDLDKLWNDLADADVKRAYEARNTLAAMGKQSAPFLLARLRISAPSPARLARLIADLDADAFQTREDASGEPARLGRAVEKELRKTRESNPSAEAAHRLDDLLGEAADFRRRPAWVRTARAVTALEHVQAPEGRQALEELVKGPPGAPVTEEATAALNRITLMPSER